METLKSCRRWVGDRKAPAALTPNACSSTQRRETPHRLLCIRRSICSRGKPRHAEASSPPLGVPVHSSATWAHPSCTAAATSTVSGVTSVPDSGYGPPEAPGPRATNGCAACLYGRRVAGSGPPRSPVTFLAGSSGPNQYAPDAHPETSPSSVRPVHTLQAWPARLGQTSMRRMLTQRHLFLE